MGICHIKKHMGKVALNEGNFHIATIRLECGVCHVSPEEKDAWR